MSLEIKLQAIGIGSAEEVMKDTKDLLAEIEPTFIEFVLSGTEQDLGGMQFRAENLADAQPGLKLVEEAIDHLGRIQFRARTLEQKIPEVCGKISLRVWIRGKSISQQVCGYDDPPDTPELQVTELGRIVRADYDLKKEIQKYIAIHSNEATVSELLSAFDMVSTSEMHKQLSVLLREGTIEALPNGAYRLTYQAYLTAIVSRHEGWGDGTREGEPVSTPDLREQILDFLAIYNDASFEDLGIAFSEFDTGFLQGKIHELLIDRMIERQSDNRFRLTDHAIEVTDLGRVQIQEQKLQTLNGEILKFLYTQGDCRTLNKIEFYFSAYSKEDVKTALDQLTDNDFLDLLPGEGYKLTTQVERWANELIKSEEVSVDDKDQIPENELEISLEILRLLAAQGKGYHLTRDELRAAFIGLSFVNQNRCVKWEEILRSLLTKELVEYRSDRGFSVSEKAYQQYNLGGQQ